MNTENKFSTSMQKKDWIETIINSTNGITQVAPNDNLFSKIQLKIQHQNKVSAKTIWLVAASVAALILLNLSIINTKSEAKDQSADYWEMTVNKSNQLY